MESAFAHCGMSINQSANGNYKDTIHWKIRKVAKTRNLIKLICCGLPSNFSPH